MTGSPRKIGILAGGGSLPIELVATCREQGIPHYLLWVAQPPSPAPEAEQGVVRLGAISRTLYLLRQHRVTDLVMAGSLRRPTLRSLRPDAKAVQWLWRLGLSFCRGDDRLLRGVATLLEGEGFRVIGADSLLRHSLAEEGPLGTHTPSPAERDDLHLGYHAAKALGGKDLGQAVIFRDGQPLGMEDRDGTDALIARCAVSPGKGGVLVKAAKPGQERRADLPAIGPETIERLADGGFRGIGLEAGASLILRRAQTIAAADAAGIFVYGLNGEGR